MKKILIMGQGSYIGESFKKYLEAFGESYVCHVCDTVGDGWRTHPFEGYDAVYQVAGLAHLKETPELRDKYFYINCDLAVECARKAKASGVPLFVYISSVSVYGMTSGVITRETEPAPNTYYGESKLKAEGILRSMEDGSFRVAILRPPMVYGKDCKGNFVTLTKFALKSPVFPSIKNKRSMIFVDNLSEFVRRVIDRGEGGLYFPQNGDYVCTSEMVEYIAMYSGKMIRLTGLFDPIIPHVKAKVFRKVFGDLFYDFQDDAVDTVPFEESVRLSVSHE